MSGLQSLGYFLAGIFFVFFGIFDSIYWKHTLTILRQKNIPAPVIVFIIGIAWEIIGGILIIINVYSQYAAIALIPFTIAYVFLFYPFWKYQHNERRINLLLFATNITVTLAVLFFIASIS